MSKLKSNIFYFLLLTTRNKRSKIKCLFRKFGIFKKTSGILVVFSQFDKCYQNFGIFRYTALVFYIDIHAHMRHKWQVVFIYSYFGSWESFEPLAVAILFQHGGHRCKKHYHVAL